MVSLIFATSVAKMRLWFKTKLNNRFNFNHNEKPYFMRYFHSLKNGHELARFLLYTFLYLIIL